MSTRQLLLDNDDSDWALFENIRERRIDTHIPRDESDGALAVTVNTGTLGSGGAAVSVAAGAAVVNDTEHSIAQQTVDIAHGDSRPRRDVVYATTSGALDVAQGTPAEPAWGEGVAEGQRALANAALPAPRTFGEIEGLALAVITVPGNNATALGSGSNVVDDSIRAFERQTFDLGEAFADGEFGYRRLSSFDTFQSALDHSANQDVGIYVDGEIVTDELGVTVPGSGTSTLVGDAGQITVDTSQSGPFLQLPDANNIKMRWSGVYFQNEQTARQFIVPPSAYSGYLGTDTYWQDININQFGGSPYTVDLENVYVSTFQNVHIWNRYRAGDGAIRLVNANACEIGGLKVNRSNAADGETPPVYLDGCVGTTLYSPHVENSATDACIQMSGGDGAIIGAHIEPHSETANCGIQIGDGGVSTGNTAGATGYARWGIYNPVIHGMGVADPDHIRVLNADGTHIAGGQALTINYGGSNNDSGLAANPGGVTVTGNHDVSVKNGTSAPAQVDIGNGQVFADASAASSGLVPHEWGWIDTGSATRIARKEGDGTLRVWRAADDPRRESVVGPITTNHTASHGEVVLFDTSSASYTCTLPPAGEGKRVLPTNVLSSAGNSVTIDTPGSGTVDGSATLAVATAGTGTEVVCDGTDWWRVSTS